MSQSNRFKITRLEDRIVPGSMWWAPSCNPCDDGSRRGDSSDKCGGSSKKSKKSCKSNKSSKSHKSAKCKSNKSNKSHKSHKSNKSKKCK